MIAEIPYMIVWGFFSAMGWMSANWTVEKIYPEKVKDPPAIIQQDKKEDAKPNPNEK